VKEADRSFTAHMTDEFSLAIRIDALSRFCQSNRIRRPCRKGFPHYHFVFLLLQ
jgi:hypothetical protein